MSTVIDTAPVAIGRPAGEIRQAVLQAITALHTPDRSPILLEIAREAKVGRVATKYMLCHLVRANCIVKVRRRFVAHSRKPVWEYAAADVTDNTPHGWNDLWRQMQGLARYERA